MFPIQIQLDLLIVTVTIQIPDMFTVNMGIRLIKSQISLGVEFMHNTKPESDDTWWPICHGCWIEWWYGITANRGFQRLSIGRY